MAKEFHAPERTVERGRGCWNCVDGDALILTDQGATRLHTGEITSLVRNDCGWKAPAAWVPSGVSPVLEIQTTYGARVRVTPDHRIFTDRGWIAAIDLRKGDEVAGMPESVIGRSRLDRREAHLIGAITGDGWVNTAKGVGFGFASSRAPAWHDMIRYAQDRFESRERPHVKTPTDPRFYQLEWRTKAARKFAAKIDKNHVPGQVWRASPEVIGAYLRGLFSTDGTLMKAAPGVAFYQTSKLLVEEVQLLLRMIGIPSHVRVDLRGPRYKDLYSVSVRRKAALDRFADLIGFDDTYRQAKLLEALKTARSRGVPERIRSVTPSGTCAVYDISVPDGNSFFANALLVHNCSHYDCSDKARQHYRSRTMQEKFALRARQLPVLDRLASDDASVRDVAKRAEQLIKQGFNQREAEQIASASVQRELQVVLDEARRDDARFQRFDAMVATGQIGVCLIGKAPGDFVDHRYLCAHWDGRDGSSVATAGKPLDKLPEELRDDLDGKAKKA